MEPTSAESVEIIPAPGRLQTDRPPDEVIKRLAFLFCEERDYRVSSRRKVLSWLRGWWESGIIRGGEYRDHLEKDRGLSRKTIGTMFGVLRNFGEFLVERGVLRYNPFRNVVVRGSRSRRRRRAFSEEEVERLLRYVYRECNARDRAIICLMLATGLRTQAVIDLDLSDYKPDLDPARLMVRHKGRWEKDAFVFVYETLQGILGEWLALRPRLRAPHSAFFTTLAATGRRLAARTLRGMVTSVITAVGIDGVPHQLRHTAITIARKKGTPLEVLKEMAGHSSIRTTEIYDHSVQRERFAPEKALDEVLKDAQMDRDEAEAPGEGTGTPGDQ